MFACGAKRLKISMCVDNEVSKTEQPAQLAFDDSLRPYEMDTRIHGVDLSYLCECIKQPHAADSRPSSFTFSPWLIQACSRSAGTRM